MRIEYPLSMHIMLWPSLQGGALRGWLVGDAGLCGSHAGVSLRNCLFTPELQRQSRGQRRFSLGKACDREYLHPGNVCCEVLGRTGVRQMLRTVLPVRRVICM